MSAIGAHDASISKLLIHFIFNPLSNKNADKLPYHPPQTNTVPRSPSIINNWSINHRLDCICPFEKRSLPNYWLNQYNLLKLPAKKGVTINTITTDKKIAERYRTKYKAQIESMEGAALHYIGRDLNIPFIQIRSVSNYVGERNKAKWKMQEAIYNLNEVVSNYVDALSNHPF